jgi:hypothetical protein
MIRKRMVEARRALEKMLPTGTDVRELRDVKDDGTDDNDSGWLVYPNGGWWYEVRVEAGVMGPPRFRGSL